MESGKGRSRPLENGSLMSTILVLLDALRHDCLDANSTPFLWKCAMEGEYYQRVVPSIGFCERTEILTGMNGAESGYLAAIGFAPSDSPFAKTRGLTILHLIEASSLRLMRFMPAGLSNRIRRRLRSLPRRYFRKRGISMAPYQIPYPWLKYFALTEDHQDLRKPGAFSQESIFDLLLQNQKTHFYDTFTALGMVTPHRTDRDRLRAVIDDIGCCPKDLYLVYVSIPDAFGHRLGPDTEEYRCELQKMDSLLEQFVNRTEEVSPENTYLFIGDHGMMTVQEQFDAGSEISDLLRRSGLKIGKDVIYFLDSTMTRLWAMSKKAKSVLPESLHRSAAFAERGQWVHEDSARRHRIRWPDRRYGDHLWIANPGVLVYPDFFHQTSPCKGMHGYDPSISESQGVCVRWGSGVEQQMISSIPLTCVFDLLKRSLKL